MGVPHTGWFIMEIIRKWMILEYRYFGKPPLYIYIYIGHGLHSYVSRGYSPRKYVRPRAGNESVWNSHVPTD